MSTSQTFDFPVRVYWEDTDGAGIVYYASYLRFLERARTEWLRSLGFDQGRLARELGIAFAVRTAHVEYLRPARLDDSLIVSARIDHVGASVIEFSQHIMRADERLVEAAVRIACVKIAAFQPARIPRVLRAALAV